MQIFIMVFLSIPSLVLLLTLIIILSYQLKLAAFTIPFVGIETSAQIAKGYIIPIIAMALPSIAGLTRLLRAELSEVLTSEFVMLAKTKG